MRKLFMVMACMAVIFGVGATAALAGEVTGKGKTLWTNTDQWNAEHALHGKSACAYSGVEDDQFRGEEGNLNPDYNPDAGHSQSWGQVVKGIATNGGVGAIGGHAGVPGEACNPTKGGFEE